MIKLNHLQPLESFKTNAWYYLASITSDDGGTSYTQCTSDFNKVINETERIINNNIDYLNKHDRANVKILYMYYGENVLNDNNVLYDLKGRQTC